MDEFTKESQNNFKKKAKERVQFSTKKLIGRQFESDNDVQKFILKLQTTTKQNYFQRDMQPKNLRSLETMRTTTFRIRNIRKNQDWDNEKRCKFTFILSKCFLFINY